MEKHGFQRLQVIGKGAFGAAVLVKSNRDGALYVAKEVNLQSMKPAEKQEALNEIKVLSTLTHPNITKFLDAFEEHNTLFIVMEYADGGDLWGTLQKRNGNLLSEETVLNYFVQLCLAMHHMHTKHILHRDLKCQNVFMTKTNVVKLGDFGISRIMSHTQSLAMTKCGTPYYFSPELCSNQPYNQKSDIWALGCILYELAALKHAFNGNSMNELAYNISHAKYPPISSQYSSSLHSLITSMLTVDPGRRPSIKDILRFPCVQNAIQNIVTSSGMGKVYGEILVPINPIHVQADIEDRQQALEAIERVKNQVIEQRKGKQKVLPKVKPVHRKFDFDDDLNLEEPPRGPKAAERLAKASEGERVMDAMIRDFRQREAEKKGIDIGVIEAEEERLQREAEEADARRREEKILERQLMAKAEKQRLLKLLEKHRKRTELSAQAANENFASLQPDIPPAPPSLQPYVPPAPAHAFPYASPPPPPRELPPLTPPNPSLSPLALALGPSPLNGAGVRAGNGPNPPPGVRMGNGPSGRAIGPPPPTPPENAPLSHIVDNILAGAAARGIDLGNYLNLVDIVNNKSRDRARSPGAGRHRMAPPSAGRVPEWMRTPLDARRAQELGRAEAGARQNIVRKSQQDVKGLAVRMRKRLNELLELEQRSEMINQMQNRIDNANRNKVELQRKASCPNWNLDNLFSGDETEEDEGPVLERAKSQPIINPTSNPFFTNEPAPKIDQRPKEGVESSPRDNERAERAVRFPYDKYLEGKLLSDHLKAEGKERARISRACDTDLHRLQVLFKSGLAQPGTAPPTGERPQPGRAPVMRPPLLKPRKSDARDGGAVAESGVGVVVSRANSEALQVEGVTVAPPTMKSAESGAVVHTPREDPLNMSAVVRPSAKTMTYSPANLAKKRGTSLALDLNSTLVLDSIANLVTPQEPLSDTEVPSSIISFLSSCYSFQDNYAEVHRLILKEIKQQHNPKLENIKKRLGKSVMDHTQFQQELLLWAVQCPNIDLAKSVLKCIKFVYYGLLAVEWKEEDEPDTGALEALGNDAFDLSISLDVLKKSKSFK